MPANYSLPPISTILSVPLHSCSFLISPLTPTFTFGGLGLPLPLSPAESNERTPLLDSRSSRIDLKEGEQRLSVHHRYAPPMTPPLTSPLDATFPGRTASFVNGLCASFDKQYDHFQQQQQQQLLCERRVSKAEVEALNALGMLRRDSHEPAQTTSAVTTPTLPSFGTFLSSSIDPLSAPPLSRRRSSEGMTMSSVEQQLQQNRPSSAVAGHSRPPPLGPSHPTSATHHEQPFYPSSYPPYPPTLHLHPAFSSAHTAPSPICPTPHLPHHPVLPIHGPFHPALAKPRTSLPNIYPSFPPSAFAEAASSTRRGRARSHSTGSLIVPPLYRARSFFPIEADRELMSSILSPRKPSPRPDSCSLSSAATMFSHPRPASSIVIAGACFSSSAPAPAPTPITTKPKPKPRAPTTRKARLTASSSSSCSNANTAARPPTRASITAMTTNLLNARPPPRNSSTTHPLNAVPTPALLASRQLATSVEDGSGGGEMKQLMALKQVNVDELIRMREREAVASKPVYGMSAGEIKEKWKKQDKEETPPVVIGEEVGEGDGGGQEKKRKADDGDGMIAEEIEKMGREMKKQKSEEDGQVQGQGNGLKGLKVVLRKRGLMKTMEKGKSIGSGKGDSMGGEEGIADAGREA